MKNPLLRDFFFIIRVLSLRWSKRNLFLNQFLLSLWLDPNRRKDQGFMIFAKKLVPPTMKWSRSFHFTSSLHLLPVPPPIFLNANLMRPFSHRTVPWDYATNTHNCYCFSNAHTIPKHGNGLGLWR